MNPIQKAIADIKFKIPMDVLMAAFAHREFGQRPNPTNIDTAIRYEVIEAKVRPDCDLVGGTQVEIPLASVPAEFLDPYSVVYRIPKNLTQNRTISRVLSVSLGSSRYVGMQPGQTQNYSQMLNAAQAVVDAVSEIPVVSTAYIRLIAENTVLITDNVAIGAYAYLRCYLEHDTDFSQLRSTTYTKFSRLVELATKAYIYNKLAIPMGQAQLVGGQELGRFREIVDGYADAAELYETFLEETWRKVAIMDDTTSRERHLRMLVGRR